MPAISVDTFFACSLMVLLVVSAMATASKFLYPHLNSMDGVNVAERYESLSQHLILNDGVPSDWGQNCQESPETFGLAKAGSDVIYELDIDKVSRLNNENMYAVSYAEIFTSFGIPDSSFRIGLEPIFEVAINMTSISEEMNETFYEFEVLTEKYGVKVPVEIKSYVVAENHLESNDVYVSDGKTYLNITISKGINGPALLVVLARFLFNSQIMSYSAYSFAHNSTEPEPKGTFLRLSPLHYNLNASLLCSEIDLSSAHALSFNYSSMLIQTANNSQSATYSIPHFRESSPTLIVVTGWNSTSFFTEWTAYPQIPLQVGASFIDPATLSNIYTYTYIVTIDSALYSCIVWLGGPKE